MISSVNQSPAFGAKCAVILPKNTNLSAVFEKLKVENPNFPNLVFIEPGGEKVAEALGDEFTKITYIGQKDIKGTNMAKFIFDDGHDNKFSDLVFQLPAFLKSKFEPTKVVKLPAEKLDAKI